VFTFALHGESLHPIRLRPRQTVLGSLLSRSMELLGIWRDESIWTYAIKSCGASVSLFRRASQRLWCPSSRSHSSGI
jgi:hypothetical protein